MYLEIRSYRYACLVVILALANLRTVFGDTCVSPLNCNSLWKPKCCSWKWECCSQVEYDLRSEDIPEIDTKTANLAIGVVIAIVVGCLIGCVACIAGCVYCCCNNKTRQGRVLGQGTTVVHTTTQGPVPPPNAGYVAGQPQYPMGTAQPYMPPHQPPHQQPPAYAQPGYPGLGMQAPPPYPVSAPPYPVAAPPYPAGQPPMYPPNTAPQPPYPVKGHVQASAPAPY